MRFAVRAFLTLSVPQERIDDLRTLGYGIGSAEGMDLQVQLDLGVHPFPDLGPEDFYRGQSRGSTSALASGVWHEKMHSFFDPLVKLAQDRAARELPCIFPYFIVEEVRVEIQAPKWFNLPEEDRCYVQENVHLLLALSVE